ncbi:MAG: ABC transporter permease [Candidatus Altiarchaeales archaeon ex4484_43]|nr:MAG: ABC transporter permease [Candidatus Altiarchaeales archaeon ex4484_43]
MEGEMIEDYLKLATDGIMHRKLRSWLTMVGIFVGIIAVVALISLGQGLQMVIDEQFEMAGGDRIIVTPGRGGTLTGAPRGSFVAAKLDKSDLDVIEKVRGVDSAAGIILATGNVKADDKRKLIPIYGVPTDPKYQKLLRQIDFFGVDAGRYLKEGDRYKAQVGVRTRDFFDADIDVGDKIEIEGIIFDIVGKNKKTGNPFHDSKITIPIETAQELFNKSDEYSMIQVKVEKGSDVDEVAENIKEKLRRHRGVKEGEEDFTAETAENVVSVFKDVFNLVTGFLAGIAAISLLVGGIGIMTTMYTSILERTHQIGIMKAVGARNSDILLIFLIEAGMLGLVGGVIGVILGLLLSKFAEYLVVNYGGIDIFRVYAGPELIIGTLLFSFLVGCFSGYLPARRASKMHPVEALRK